MLRRRKRGLSRERLHQIIVATCPVSMWIHWGVGNPEFRKAMVRDQ